MARTRDLLDRFRPAGAPGAAAAAGVPADRIVELTAELEPVLARLDDVTAEAARIRRVGEERAESLRREATERARATLAAARRDAETDRVEAASAVLAQAEHEAAQAADDAAREAVEIHSVADDALPGYVDGVIAELRRIMRQSVAAGQATPAGGDARP